MSGIYAVLFSQTNSPWSAQLEEFATRLNQVAGTTLRTISATDSGFRHVYDNRLYHHGHGRSNAEYQDHRGLLGCDYDYPTALAKPDPGPFISTNNKVALTYDGIIFGYTGQELVDRLSVVGSANWSEEVSELNGQFSLIILFRGSNYLYYVTKTRPLFVLHDSLNRGTLISSDEDALNGMYHPVRSPRPLRLAPYTLGRISADGLISHESLHQNIGSGSLVLSGGGLDTLVASRIMLDRFPAESLSLIYFDYGAKASEQEKLATRNIATYLRTYNPKADITVQLIPFPLLGQLATSSLTDETITINQEPQAGKASEWVPARNTVLVSLALALAESRGLSRIVTGVNADAAYAYPDNDEQWNTLFQRLTPYVLGSDRRVTLEAPLAKMMKADIVRCGEKLGIDWSRATSWSRYESGAQHCGRCSSCRARRKAFTLAGVTDTTRYVK